MLRLSDVQQSELMALVHDGVSRIANLQVKTEEAAQSLKTVAEELNALVSPPASA